MARIRNYLSMIVFAHTIFAFPFALIGFFLATRYASYPFSWDKLFLVILSMVFARSAAMGFNRWADRNIDKLNPRTNQREIPAGVIPSRNALIFTCINAAAFIVSAGFLNLVCLYLSPLALLIILGYSYTKRFTRWCHLILGIGLSLAPIGAFLAVTGKFDMIPLLFSAIVFTWVSGFDIIYALQDEDFDRSQQLKSVPSTFGIRNGLRISILLHFFTAALVIACGILASFGSLYWIGASIFILMLVYQHSIVKADDLSKVTRAFGTTNGIASVIFSIFVILNLFLG